MTYYLGRKGQYDSTALQLQSNMNKLELEVKTMRDEILSAESRYRYLIAKTERQNVELVRNEVINCLFVCNTVVAINNKEEWKYFCRFVFVCFTL